MEGDGVVQRVSQISPIGGGTHLAGYLPHEIAFLHVLAAKEVEDVAVCTAYSIAAVVLPQPASPTIQVVFL